VLWHLLHQMLTGLLVLHNKKYSHHDIKPENIFLCHPITPEDIAQERYRGKLWLKLGDFGQSQAEKVECGDIMRGSMMYRSPEKIEGKRGSFPSDLFSVGVVMYADLCCRCLRLRSDVLPPGLCLQLATTLSC
jgi:serine/threonine protein kinase